MLANFIVTVHYNKKPYAVNVRVYKTVAAMRGAVTRYDRPTKKEKKRRLKAGEDRFLGICHRFELMRFRKGSQSPEETNPLCAVVRLAKPHIGAGIVAHELAHAAVWIRELYLGDPGWEEPLTASNDEEFCWVLGELVHNTVDKLYEKGIYDS